MSKSLFLGFGLRERPKAVAVACKRLLNSPSTREDIFCYPTHTMKKYLLFSLLLSAWLHAEQAATLIEPIVKPQIASPTAAPAQERLEIQPEDIISTKVVIRDGQKFTLQKVEPQEITPLPVPPPPKTLTPKQQAARAAQRASMGKFRTLMVSCTVHDDNKTLLRWQSQDKDPVEHFSAWSNVNFHHLTSLTRFKKNDTTYNVMFGIGDVDTAQMNRLHARRNTTYTPPTIPTLPADSKTSPSYLVTEGNPTVEDLAPIDGLHELYQAHHNDLVTEHQRIKAENAQRAAELAANPPDPTPDLIIRYWTPEKTLAEKQQEQLQAEHQPQEGGAK
jgi:hypothetical protein